MANVVFPPNPTVGQTVTGANGQVWVWNGTAWTAQTGAGVAFLPLTGGVISGTPGTLQVGVSSATTPAPLSVGGQGISYLTLGATGQNIGFSVNAGVPWIFQNGVAVTGMLPTVGGTMTGPLTSNSNITTSGNITTTGSGNITAAGAVCAAGSVPLAGQGTGVIAGGSGVIVPSNASYWSEVGGSQYSLIQMDTSLNINIGASGGIENINFVNGTPVFNGNGIVIPNNASLWFRNQAGDASLTGLWLDVNNNLNVAGGTNLPPNVYVNSVQGFVLNPSTCIPWAHQANWNVESDARIKEQVAEYTTGLDAILALQPITFQYNGKGGTTQDGKTRIGLDAAAASAVMPEMGCSRTMKLDETDEEETEILGLDTSPLIHALINAVKELSSRLEALEKSAGA